MTFDRRRSLIANDFGLRIGIEGERDFKAALRDINQSFKVLGSEMQLVTSQFDKNDKSVQALSSRNAVLNKEIDQQKRENQHTEICAGEHQRILRRKR